MKSLHLDILSKRKKKKNDSQSWAMSYGDMVTTLLCFFIIFYALEKKMTKKDQSRLPAHQTTDSDIKMDYAVAIFKDIPDLKVSKTSSFIDIHFKDTVFFNKGDYKLTSNGKNTLESILMPISQLKGHFHLEIQGHADSTPVSPHKGRWWKNNMELSLMRALDVHTYLIKNISNTNKLTVSGYGSPKIENSGAMDFDRKVSLRLQFIQ